MRPRSVRVAAAVLVGAVLAAAVGIATRYETRKRAEARTHAVALTGGDPDHARDLMRRYGCAGCHSVPGVRAPGGRAALPLGDVGARMYIGGVLTNSGDNLVRWIVNPKAVTPNTAMPVTGISEDEARDVAAYLYALR